MKLTSSKKNAIAQLYENESLTSNLTDSDAHALLEWAQNQITANADSKLVQAAVSAANASGIQGAPQLLAQAAAFLAQRAGTSNTPSPAIDNSPAPAQQITPVTVPPELVPAAAQTTDVPAPVSSAAGLQASGQAGETSVLSAQAAVMASADTSAPAPASLTAEPVKKTRGKSKRQKTK